VIRYHRWSARSSDSIWGLGDSCSVALAVVFTKLLFYKEGQTRAKEKSQKADYTSAWQKSRRHGAGRIQMCSNRARFGDARLH
jgi:hypothetical protein